MSKSRTAMRDEAAEKYRDEDFERNPNGYHVSKFCNSETTSTAFEAGFDYATKLDDEALKIAVRGLEHYRDYNYLNEADDVRCRASEDLSKIRELRCENDKDNG